MPAGEAVVDVGGYDQGQVGAGGGEGAAELAGLEHAAQQRDVVSGDALVVVVHGPGVDRGPQLDAGRLADDAVVAAETAWAA
jgi:hypothetical protein